MSYRCVRLVHLPVWFDYDNDGKLDLFVSSFVYYDRSLNILCTDDLSRRYYCIPRYYKAKPSLLFHNNGNGMFTDVSKESGIADFPGKSFGAVATDDNNDGRMDLFVANDTMPTFSSSIGWWEVRRVWTSSGRRLQ